MTIYDKFKATLRWILGDGSSASDRSGFAIFDSSPPASWVAIPLGAPVDASDGVSVEGENRVDISIVLNAAGATGQFRIWFFDGTNWFADQDLISVVAPTGVTNIVIPQLKTGTFSRIAIEDVGATITTLKASPAIV